MYVCYVLYFIQAFRALFGSFFLSCVFSFGRSALAALFAHFFGVSTRKHVSWLIPASLLMSIFRVVRFTSFSAIQLTLAFDFNTHTHTHALLFLSLLPFFIYFCWGQIIWGFILVYLVLSSIYWGVGPQSPKIDL